MELYVVGDCQDHAHCSIKPAHGLLNFVWGFAGIIDLGKHLVMVSYEIIDPANILAVGFSEIIDPFLCENVGTSRIIDLHGPGNQSMKRTHSNQSETGPKPQIMNPDQNSPAG